jgi:hypothetical protein
MTLLCIVFAAVAMSQQPQIAPQKKVTLPNGVALYAERMEKANGFSLSFFASTLGEPEKDGQRGYRHLIEHIVAKGRKKDIDARLEVRGLYLTADTLQDGIRFEIEGASDQLPTAIAALTELLEFSQLTQEEIDKEVAIVNEETGVRTYGSRLFAALFDTGFGTPDLAGSLSDFAKATPETLRAVYQSNFAPDRLAVAVVGDIDPTKAVELLTNVFGGLQSSARSVKRNRTLVSPLKEGFVQDSPGCGRGVPVGSLSHPDTLSVLAAAFAIASEVNGAQVMYSPTPIGGLVAIVHPSRTGLDDVDRLVAAEANRLFRNGRVSVRLWAETADQRTREKARIYGQMLLLENYFRMEDLVLRAGEVSQASFVSGLQKFYSRSCVRVGGVR